MKIQSLLLVLISGSNYECSTRPKYYKYLVLCIFMLNFMLLVYDKRLYGLPVAGLMVRIS